MATLSVFRVTAPSSSTLPPLAPLSRASAKPWTTFGTAERVWRAPTSASSSLTRGLPAPRAPFVRGRPAAHGLDPDWTETAADKLEDSGKKGPDSWSRRITALLDHADEFAAYANDLHELAEEVLRDCDEVDRVNDPRK